MPYLQSPPKIVSLPILGGTPSLLPYFAKKMAKSPYFKGNLSIVY